MEQVHHRHDYRRAEPAEFNHPTTQFPRNAYPLTGCHTAPSITASPSSQSPLPPSPIPSLLAGGCPVSVPGRLIGRLVHESVQTRAVAESRIRVGLVARLALAAAGAAPLVRLFLALAFGLGAASVVFNRSMLADAWHLYWVSGGEVLTVRVAGSRVGHVALGWCCGAGGLRLWVGLGGYGQGLSL